MQAPKIPANEPARLDALKQMGVLDTPLEERFERITRLARRVFDVPMATLSLVDHDRQWFKSSPGCSMRGSSREVSFCGHTILHDEVMVVEDARLDERFSDNPLVTGDQPVVFYAGCPVTAADGSRVGALCVMSSSARQFSAEDREMLRDLAAMASAELAVRSAQSVQAEMLESVAEATRRSLLDSLTNVWNREGIEQVIEQGLSLSKSGRFAVILCDADRFKLVNDTHGHAAGDEVLREVARRLTRVTRSQDAVGRIGGEEFLVFIAPDASVEEAREIADRMRVAIEEIPVRLPQGTLDVTMSFGVAGAEADNRLEFQGVVQRADRAMYAAKQNGRNRVETAEHTAPPPDAQTPEAPDAEQRDAA